MPRVLITGASGFVGRSMSRAFLAAGWNVTGSTRSEQDLEPGVHRIIVGDLGASTEWREALEGVDTVVHLAARVHVMSDDEQTADAEGSRVNFHGTMRLAEASSLAEVRRFIFMSTVKVNGDSSRPGHPLTEDDPAAPVGGYAVSKHDAEQGLTRLTRSTRMGAVIIRPPLVYGPGVGGNFRSMTNWVHRGYPLPLRSVNNRRSLVYVDNLSAFTLACARSEQAVGQTFLVSDGCSLSTPELLRRLGAAMDVKVRLAPVPDRWLQRAASLSGHQAAVSRLTSSLEVDVSKAQRTMGWQPPVDVDTALRQTVSGWSDGRVVGRSQ